MITKQFHCETCGEYFSVDTYSRYVFCPNCENKIDFDGFSYKEIDWEESLYDEINHWTWCPKCRSDNMFLDPSDNVWKCPDCNFLMHTFFLKSGILWFCDSCHTFMNIQENFSVKGGRWKCTVYTKLTK